MIFKALIIAALCCRCFSVPLEPNRAKKGLFDAMQHVFTDGMNVMGEGFNTAKHMMDFMNPINWVNHDVDALAGAMAGVLVENKPTTPPPTTTTTPTTTFRSWVVLGKRH